MDRIYVAIDVETTGLEAGVDEIIEVAAVKFNRTEVLETFSQLIKPKHSLPLKITRLTGISPDALEFAPRFSEVAPKLVNFVKSYPLVGHSIGFDIRMLKAQGMNFTQAAYDTFELATLLIPKAPAYRLSALSAMLGFAHDEAHRALNDSDVTRQLFNYLLDQIETLDLNVLSEINRLTARMTWPLRDLFTEAERLKARNALDMPISASSSIFGNLPNNDQYQPLTPTGNEQPVNIAQVQQFFAPTGAMGRAFQGYEQRDQQVEMASAVAQALNQGDNLMVEAGTGTGKGMSYLVPAAMFAAQRGERVVVSTNTINLQDQLYFKDIPALQKLMSDSEDDQPPFEAALLKGRGNYLCLRRYKQLRNDGRLTEEEIRTLLKVQMWLPSTGSGDRAEIMLMDKENAAWGRINATPETCVGPRCADFNNCFFFQARRQAEAAHIVVVNHALLLADLSSEANVLPPYDYVVIDEAHNLEEVATDQFGFSVNQDQLLQFLDDLFQEGGANITGGLLAEIPRHFQDSAAGQGDFEKATEIVQKLGPVVTRARTSIYDTFNRLTVFVTEEAEVSNYDPRLRLTPNVRKNPAWAEVEQIWGNLSLQLKEIGDELLRLDVLLGELKNAELVDYEMLMLRVQSHLRYCTDVRIYMNFIIAGGNEELICWISQDRMRDLISLSAAPLSVADLLRSNLFEQKASTILASATMNVGGDFTYLKERLGLDEPEELMLESPFDYTKQALVYIPQDMPEPNHKGYQPALEEAIINLCTATGGRALVLFTANSALRQTYRAIQEPLEAQEIAVLGQGIDGSRRSLLERFKESPRTVLLGTTSFWEGVDVVGDALSVLIIAKLPFSVPTDPIYAARSEHFADPFGEYSVPQSILRFKQGFGRLIRSKEDHGIVAVLDKRLISKNYGQRFLDSLPHTHVRTGPLKQLPVLASRFLR